MVVWKGAVYLFSLGYSGHRTTFALLYLENSTVNQMEAERIVQKILKQTDPHIVLLSYMAKPLRGIRNNPVELLMVRLSRHPLHPSRESPTKVA